MTDTEYQASRQIFWYTNTNINIYSAVNIYLSNSYSLHKKKVSHISMHNLAKLNLLLNTDYYYYYYYFILFYFILFYFHVKSFEQILYF